MMCAEFVEMIAGFKRYQMHTQCTSLGHHHLHELLIIDLAITVNISFPDHFIDLLICELLAQIGHNMTQLGSADETVAVAIKHLESLNEFFFRVGVLHLS